MSNDDASNKFDRDKTIEQREADEALTIAIERVIVAYYPDINLNILTDYLVLGALSDMQDGESMVFTHPRDGCLPMYRQMGLLDYIHTRHRAYVGEPDEDE
jgi:hypothetical protein